MSRAKSTRYCRLCKHHVHAHYGAPHFCSNTGRRMRYDQVRTSPDWCPLGHLLPGMVYPAFEPGPDPWNP